MTTPVLPPEKKMFRVVIGTPAGKCIASARMPNGPSRNSTAPINGTLFKSPRSSPLPILTFTCGARERCGDRHVQICQPKIGIGDQLQSAEERWRGRCLRRGERRRRAIDRRRRERRRGGWRRELLRICQTRSGHERGNRDGEAGKGREN